MSRRILLSIAVLCLLPVTALGPAQAAPRRSCKLVTDPAGDVRLPAFSMSDPRDFEATDLVSADVASTATHLTATVRVRNLSGWESESVGIAFAFGLTVGRTRFGLEAMKTTSRDLYFGESYSLWRMSGGSVGRETWRYAGKAAGWFDEDYSEIVVYVELAQLGLTGRSRGQVTQLRVEGKQVEDGLVAGRAHTVDDAESESTYPLSAPSCAPAYKGGVQ